jgi:hypothetical protein
MATQARAVLKIPARIVGAGNISATLENGIYVISDQGGASPSTVAGLPSAINRLGTRRIVTDATSNAFGSVVAGGGSFVVPVYSDNTLWRVG